MHQIKHLRVVETPPANEPGDFPPLIDSAHLLEGRREMTIRHGENIYRLKLTASGRLILTK
jgi:hemin uptake protein HemP